ncbi:hypothetical protein NQ318_005144 [Aromia moschata]|uniref:Uncharacterized protein n=1 Tax=Aromia moschata TaxID=1265417 RepID=A0AAV8YBP3_9CUCU|nr:hypothetical protein NQ318_005144 [Aromia moschata]
MLDPYHYTPVRQLSPQDLPPRLQFTQFLQNMQTENPNFLNTILFTNEAITRREIFNWRNNYLWDSENPHPVKDSSSTRCTIRIKRKCGLCMTEPHHILPCHCANICMSIFVIGGLAVEVDLFGHREVQI